MSREEIYREIEEHFGLVPSVFKQIPDSYLEHEWGLLKALELEEGPIPSKYRKLIGIAVAAAIRSADSAHCRIETAKLEGATDEEIGHALHLAKSIVGWSTYFSGVQVDAEKAKEEQRRVFEFMRSKRGAKAA